MGGSPDPEADAEGIFAGEIADLEIQRIVSTEFDGVSGTTRDEFVFAGEFSGFSWVERIGELVLFEGVEGEPADLAMEFELRGAGFEPLGERGFLGPQNFLGPAF
jgi:hypothetical protein